MRWMAALLVGLAWSAVARAYDGTYEMIEDTSPLNEFLDRQEFSIQEHGREVMRFEEDTSPLDELLGREHYRIVDCDHSAEC